MLPNVIVIISNMKSGKTAKSLTVLGSDGIKVKAIVMSVEIEMRKRMESVEMGIRDLFSALFISICIS